MANTARRLKTRLRKCIVPIVSRTTASRPHYLFDHADDRLGAVLYGVLLPMRWVGGGQAPSNCRRSLRRPSPTLSKGPPRAPAPTRPWSQIPSRRGCWPPGEARRRPPLPLAGDALVTGTRSDAEQHARGWTRPGLSRGTRRYRCTGARRPPTCRPTRRDPSQPPRAPHQGRRAAHPLNDIAGEVESA